jgi:hypothetical protein
METALKCNVEIRIGLIQEFFTGGLNQDETVESDVLSCTTNSERQMGVLKPSRSLDYSEEIHKKIEHCSCTSADGGGLQSSNVPMIVSNRNSRMHGTRGQEVSVAQSNIAALDEQRLESAWLQAAEKHTSVMLNQARPERNQILPQGGGQHCGRSSITTVVPSRQIDNDLTDELKALKISDSHGPQKGQNTQTENGYAISPSLLHRNNHLANCDNESV